MDEQRYRNRAQLFVLIGAGLLLLLLIAAWISEGMSKEWRRVQKEYAAILEDKSEPGFDAFERGIFQLDLPAFKRSDRCVSCHHGLENPDMKQQPQPHTTHPGNFLADHPVQQYGCTICHGGQPGALSREEAFGQHPDTHWPYPLLEQPYIQSSCGKCHLAIFNDKAMDGPEAGLSGMPDGMDQFLSGKTIFSAEGCLGCHQARGVGGILGPDLTEQGEKTKHEYSFQNIQGDQTISNWLKEHFRNPEMVSPGSQMLRINLDEKEMETLATFVMGLARPDISFDYFSMATLSEFKGKREALEGEVGYASFCSACHGKSGEGKGYEEFKIGIPAIGSPDFLRVASPEYIRFTLEKGRSLRQMGSWEEEISGLSPEELDGITVHLKGLMGSGSALDLTGKREDSQRGRQLFDRYCTTCHGDEGQGGVAVALNQDGLLGRADDRFIAETLLRGRRNTAMPGWWNLEGGQLADLLSYVSSWRRSTPSTGDMELPEADLEQGAFRYHFLCFRCHGEFGEGETGPSIINRDFLEAASDRMLYETIALGRAHTAMFGWSADVYNQEKLGIQDISNIIGHMRSSAKSKLSYVHQGSNPGQHPKGAILFEQHCAACHGKTGEGLKAPALQNQELLSAASNGYLLATITLGRSGTAMPSWGYEEEEHPQLSGEERLDLVAYIRSFQRIHLKF
ncbi:MAG: c-type cytochrome [Bacteroidales bacterium]|nr:c-type cytochrome [Bacteroidales bacterium]